MFKSSCIKIHVIAGVSIEKWKYRKDWSQKWIFRLSKNTNKTKNFVKNRFEIWKKDFKNFNQINWNYWTDWPRIQLLTFFFKFSAELKQNRDIIKEMCEKLKNSAKFVIEFFSQIVKDTGSVKSKAWSFERALCVSVSYRTLSYSKRARSTKLWVTSVLSLR